MRAVIRNRAEGLNFIHRLCNEQGESFKPLTISVRPFQSFRNLDQNAKCHAMIRDLAEHTGYSEAEMKQVAKAHFGPWKTIQLKDSVLTRRIPKGTSEYTRPEMSDFIDRLYQLGAETGCGFSEDT